MDIDVERLKEDLIDYFTTAINTFDVDIVEVEDIYDYSVDQLIDIAHKNGFNIKNYEVDLTDDE